MKRLVALLLSVSMLLTACSTNSDNVLSNSASSSHTEVGIGLKPIPDSAMWNDVDVDYNALDDVDLLAHVEDLIYSETVNSLNSEDYFIENVSAIYVSKEYLAEVAFNSQPNIYFGYTLDELNEAFQGNKYIFTLGADGITTVKELVEIEDNSAEEMLKNIAIGTGVILVCVTVSIVSGGASAPAVGMIFAASAKTGAIMAVSSGAIGGISAGVVKGIETGNMDEALKAAALAGSEGFMCGAMSGGASQAIALKGATLNGLTMNEAAVIQKQSGYPLDVIKRFKSIDQYNICQNAGLAPRMINGHTALVRNIDLNYVDDFGRTNLERMREGLAALDPATGNPYQLHHIGQKVDSTLAILTEAEHMQGGNNLIWHDVSKITEVHGIGNNWDSQRQAFWKSMAEILGG